MESHSQLDIVGGAAIRRLTLSFIFLILVGLPVRGAAQAEPPLKDRISEVKQLYDQGRWADVIQTAHDPDGDVADLELYRGLALARMLRLDEARKTFEAGLMRDPRETRFLVELAGIAYREKRFSEAKRNLRRALSIDSDDDYTNNFLASIYFLEDNLEAGLKYWNRTGRPKLADFSFDPTPKLNPLVLDRAFAFSPGSPWLREQFLSTQAKLSNLDLYPRLRFDLAARPDGAFDLAVHASETDGWGSTRWEGALSLLRGLPYQSIYPEFYNVDHAGLNWRSFVRWDDQKRRLYTEIAAPLAEDPAIRYRIYFDGRNENWNVAGAIISGISGVPSPASFNLESAVAGAEIHFIPTGRWQWKAGVEYTYRTFRNSSGIAAGAAPFLTNGSSIALQSGVQRALIRIPERRFTLDSRATGEVGTFFERPLGKYGRIGGSLSGDWFPKARGEDYETQASLRGGETFGMVPLDKLFILGFDRDNDLWLRGHPGLRDGEKGNAPLGRNFVLLNLETDKVLYSGSLVKVKIGPFLDTGKIFDPSSYFGSSKWLWDTGPQMKIRILGSFQFVLGYGKDLRTGNNSFFTMVSK
jgi:tetratricopeptide (TPR) repeat protein